MMEEFTTSDGAALAYCIEGPKVGPVVMLSNSLGTDSRLWDFQAARLRTACRVLRYDSRGHGRSSSPAAEYSLERLALDATELLDFLGVPRAAFAGISLGGMVGQWLGAHAPQRIRALVLCNTSAYLPPPETWVARIESVRSGGLASIADAVIARWFTPRFLSQSLELTAAAREMLLATSPVGYAGSCAAIRDLDLRGLGSRIDVPTLIIAGAQDTATPPSHSEALRAEIPGGRLQYLSAAHLSNLEQPEAFTSCLCDFLATH